MTGPWAGQSVFLLPQGTTHFRLSRHVKTVSKTLELDGCRGLFLGRQSGRNAELTTRFHYWETYELLESRLYPLHAFMEYTGLYLIRMCRYILVYCVLNNESEQWQLMFSKRSRPVLGAHNLLFSQYQRSFTGVKRTGREVEHNLRLAPKLRKV